MSRMVIAKIHVDPIPRCGGSSHYSCCVHTYAMFWLSDVSALSGFLYWCGNYCSYPVLVDDRYDLDYKWKFAGQIVGVAVFSTGQCRNH